MSLFDYVASQDLERRDVPFDALIMAAMRKADSVNIWKLRSAWPELWTELEARYHAPGGVLSSDSAEVEG